MDYTHHWVSTLHTEYLSPGLCWLLDLFPPSGFANQSDRPQFNSQALSYWWKCPFESLAEAHAEVWLNWIIDDTRAFLFALDYKMQTGIYLQLQQNNKILPFTSLPVIFQRALVLFWRGRYGMFSHSKSGDVKPFASQSGVFDMYIRRNYHLCFTISWFRCLQLDHTGTLVVIARNYWAACAPISILCVSWFKSAP